MLILRVVTSESHLTTTCVALIISFMLLTIFMALAPDDDILNPTYKALIGSVVFPTRETAISEHNT